jgi:hypothetical protein
LPRKITDSLNQGQEGKIFLQAYPERVSGYQIAKKIYKVDTFPPTSRVYTTLKHMKGRKFIHQDEKGFLSRAEPVAARVRERLAATSAPLTQGEEKRILEILGSTQFRRQIGQTEDFRRCSEEAAETILSELGKLACIALVAKGYYPEPDRALAKKFRKYLARSPSAIDAAYEQGVKPFLDEEIQKEIEDSLNQQMHSAITDIFFFVIETDKTILQKLVRLLSKEDYLLLKHITKLSFISTKGAI